MDMFDDENSTDPNSILKIHDYRVSKFGYKFNLNEIRWKLDNSLEINWELIDRFGLDQQLVIGMRNALADYASELSASYTYNCFSWFKKIFEVTGSTELTIATVQNFLSTLDKLNEYKLGAIRGFLLDWHDKKYPGISNQVASYLSELKLKGNLKGKAVLKECPHSGPYNLQEQQAILVWAVNAFANNILSLEEYTWLITIFYTGSRSVEQRSISIGDLKVNKSTDGKETYVLKKVLAKKRNASYRGVFDEIEIDEDLALLLTNQANSTIRYIESQLNEKIPINILNEIPVFIEKKRVDATKTISEFLINIKSMPDYYFLSAPSAKDLMKSISQKCVAKTHRLNGEYIHLTNRRFRYTLATNARRRGLSKYHIAKMLGHVDVQHVGVYVQNTNEAVDLIDEAMTEVLAPLAQAFAGTLINDERDAIRANDPRSRIKSTTGAGVGSCGEFGFCASGGRQCYLCSKFQPWVHGQHEKVLESVLEERDNLRKKGASQFVIQATDRVVLAITEVIQLCKKAKNEVSDK